MEIGEKVKQNLGGHDVLVVKQEPMDELGYFSSSSWMLAGSEGESKVGKATDKIVKVEFGEVNHCNSGRIDNVTESKQDPVGELDHSSTNLSSLSESLQEITTSTLGDPTNISLVAYSTSDEDSESEDSPPSSGSEDSSPESLSSSSIASDSGDKEPVSKGSEQNTDEENEQIKILEPPKTKKELMLQDLPQVPFIDFRLGENEEVSFLGKVSSIIGQLVVVASNRDNPALNEDTVLFKEDRHPIGVVFELFGPVPNPFYTVRFNSTKDITDLGLALGSNIYFAPKKEEITNYVFVKQLEAMKGTDASWANDEEPPPDAIDYSDDEMERIAKREKMMEREKRKAAKRREESGTSSDAQTESSPGQQSNREDHMNSNHPPGYHHQRRGPPQSHHGHGPPHPPTNQRGSHQPFHDGSLHPPFDQRGPHPPFDQRGLHPSFSHGGPRPPFCQRGPHPPFNHRGQHAPFDQRGLYPPFNHRGPHAPFDQRGPRPPFHAPGPHEQYIHRGPHPPRYRFPHGPMGPPTRDEPFHQQPWIPPGMPPQAGGDMFHHGEYPHPSSGDGPSHQNGYGGY